LLDDCVAFRGGVDLGGWVVLGCGAHGVSQACLGRDGPLPSRDDLLVWTARLGQMGRQLNGTDDFGSAFRRAVEYRTSYHLDNDLCPCTRHSAGMRMQLI
jgi:hypothetical protein